MDFAAACGGVRELSCGSRDGDDFGGIISADTERRAGSALAVDAMTGNDDPGWLFRKRERERTAAASGVAHRKSPIVFQANLQMEHYLQFAGLSPVYP